MPARKNALLITLFVILSSDCLFFMLGQHSTLRTHRDSRVDQPEALTGQTDVGRVGGGGYDRARDEPDGRPIAPSPPPAAAAAAAVVRRGNGTCAPRNGAVVSALLGLLGNDLFEVAFANRMAAELCWGVVYRNAWLAGKFLREGGRECFPNAFLPPPHLTAGEAAEIDMKPSLWTAAEEGVEPWIHALEERDELLPCRHTRCDFTQGGTDELLERLRKETSKYRVFYAKAFFIHHGWMRGWEEDIRHWLKADSSCCRSVPPEEAVAIHIRDFEGAGEYEPNVAMMSGFYKHLLGHYGLRDRPVWIVCQPLSVNSSLVQDLVGYFPNAVVKPGVNEYDAFCILQRAKTLVLSHKSTFSQAAALSAHPDVVVHYPVFNYSPFLTVSMPTWKYHLVNNNRSHIDEFEVPADKMTFRMDSETPEDVQVKEVGIGPVEYITGYASGRFCASWDRNMDGWWTHNPEWDADSATDSKQCFLRRDDERSRFLRQVYDLQWNGNCSAVHTRHMWSSGWGADFNNVADGMLFGYEERRPFQITFHPGDEWWHYAAVKRDGSNPTCGTKDMFCYFLPLGKCEPGPIEENYRYPDADNLHVKWLTDYATRPQQWLRRSVYDYIREKAPHVPTPCTAMHVRRADVVLHDVDSRKYFPISDYLAKSNAKEGDNILLFTDDANAIEEAHEFHPEYNWIYLDRKRHRGSKGGWENQTPSRNPKEEVIILLSIFELAKKCDRFVYTSSKLANVIYHAMQTTGRPIERVKFDVGIERFSQNNTSSEAELRKYLRKYRIARRKAGKKGEVPSRH